MGRTDFVENRAEVIKNIYTLYSYAIRLGFGAFQTW